MQHHILFLHEFIQLLQLQCPPQPYCQCQTHHSTLQEYIIHLLIHYPISQLIDPTDIPKHPIQIFIGQSQQMECNEFQ